MSLEGFLATMSDLDVDGVELTAYYFDPPVTPAALRQTARRCFLQGLEVAGTAVGNTFALAPGPERVDQLAMCAEWIGRSSVLGSRCLRVFAGAAPDGVTDSTARGWVIDCLRTLLPLAARRGVILALENHGGVVAEPDGLLEILDALPSPWLGVKLDTGNFATANPYADIARIAPYAVSTHVKTDIRVNGTVVTADLSRVCAILRDAGYRGYLNLEYEGAEPAETAVPSALRRLLELARA